MTKEQKYNYIQEVADKFRNSRNHGHNGNNWWYPKEDTMAYNVKMYSAGIDIDKVKAKMTDRQKDYYKNDDIFEDLYYDYLNMECQFLSDEIEEIKGVKETSFAGRSGGWFEVEYYNSLSDYDIDQNLESFDRKDLEEAYTVAKELDELEARIEQEVGLRKQRLEKHLASEDFIDYIVENLMTDEDIAEIYKGKIKDLADKLK
jgi:hypothetical protein